MTITGFLLARITEDEAAARRLLRYAQENELACKDPRLLGREIPGWHEWPDVQAMCARVLAKCEAKRRIVEVHQPLPDDPEPFCWNCDEEAWPCKTMAYLALPYADHPDCDEAWRA